MCERVLLRSDGKIYKNFDEARFDKSFGSMKNNSISVGIKKWENNFKKYTTLSGERKEFKTGEKQTKIGGYEWKLIEVGPNCFREWTGLIKCADRPGSYEFLFE